MKKVLIIAFLVTLATLVVGQNITIQEKNASCQKIFKEIEKQTGYGYFNNSAYEKSIKNMDINVKDMPLKEFLDMYFQNKPCTYSIIEKCIVLHDKDKPVTDPAAAIFNTGNSFEGKVIDHEDNPLPNANVTIDGTNKTVTTNEEGVFTIKDVDSAAILVISYVNCVSQRIEASDVAKKAIKLNVQNNELITVTINTGYQSVPRERATGAFTFINNELLNRRVSTDVLGRLSGTGSGISFQSNGGNSTESPLRIRGTNTIFSRTQPLIVVNNLPYPYDLSNINPNDIESISVLKDAGAASIWGAYSGNGVIVITTKKGKLNQAIKVEVQANVTGGQKPDLNYNPKFIQPSDWIDLEIELLNNNMSTGSLTPVARILNKRRAGLISASDSANQIDVLRKYDVRNDFNKYFFQHELNQQYSVSIRGGSKSHAYQLSAGYDRNIPALTFNKYQRITLNTNNTVAITPKLELQAGFNYTITQYANNNGGIDAVSLGDKPLYPYAQLANQNGDPQPIPRRLPVDEADTIQSAVDWHYLPLEEIQHANNTTRLNNTSVNTKLVYKVFPGLRLEGIFQYATQNSTNRNVQGLQLFSTRDLINIMYNPNGTTDKLRNPVPIGSILDEANSALKSSQLRGQVNYDKTFQGKHTVSAIAGAEKSIVDIEYISNRNYGYNENTGASVAAINYVDRFISFRNMEGGLMVPQVGQRRTTSDVQISYFINASYTYDEKYIITGSARKDGVNLFGVTFNNRFTPLWSAGASWLISNENFFQLSWVSYLKLRSTFGYTGNVNNNIAAAQTLTISTTANSQGLRWSTINNPENPDLGWERIRHFNVGLDIEILNKRITGHVDSYFKKCDRLIGLSKLAPSAGYAGLGMQGYMTNKATTENHGIDIDITSKIIQGKFSWSTFFTYSLFKDKVTAYEQEFTSLAVAQANGGYNDIHTPVVGKPLSGIFSYKSAGLDPTNGDPRGFLGKEPSNNYDALINSPVSSMQYNGPAQPVSFGAIINTFSWNNFTLSACLSYKLGYVFRASTINYFALYTTGSIHQDYYRRWQNPGDNTNVPSMSFPLNSTSRDDFYTNSETNVYRADHIRFQDIRFSYDFKDVKCKNNIISNIQLYLFANDLGLIWKANKISIDPDFAYSNYRIFSTLSFGAKINF